MTATAFLEGMNRFATGLIAHFLSGSVDASCRYEGETSRVSLHGNELGTCFRRKEVGYLKNATLSIQSRCEAEPTHQNFILDESSLALMKAAAQPTN